MLVQLRFHLAREVLGLLLKHALQAARFTALRTKGLDLLRRADVRLKFSKRFFNLELLLRRPGLQALLEGLDQLASHGHAALAATTRLSSASAARPLLSAPFSTPSPGESTLVLKESRFYEC